MSETLNEIIEHMIVIDRCLDNMFTTAIVPLHEVAENLMDLNLSANSSDILALKYAPQYASVMAIEPIREAVVFEEGNFEETVRSGYYDIETETIDITFSFEIPYTYGDFAVIILSSVIDLTNKLVKLINSEEETVEETVIRELRQVAALTTIHRSIAEKDFTLAARQTLLDAAYYVRKNLNELTETADD